MQRRYAAARKVQVSLAPNLTTSAQFAEKLGARTTQDAARFGRAGAAKELRIAVHWHSYKNPVARAGADKTAMAAPVTAAR